MKNDRVMPIRRSRAKVAVGLVFWAESWLFWPHFLRNRLQICFDPPFTIT